MAKQDRKERNGSISRLTTQSLDNVKRFIDHTADEVAKADMIGAGRRIADQLIDGTKETIEKVSEHANNSDTMSAVRSLATGAIDGARDLVRVTGEETQRINLIDTGSKVAQEGLSMLRRQLDLMFDVTADLGETVGERMGDLNDNISSGIKDIGNMMPFGMGNNEGQKRPGVITRVEIESDKGTIHTESRAGGGGGKGDKH